MLCQKCNHNQANTHIKTMVNGKVEEYMLCSQCAMELGYQNMFSPSLFSFDNMFGSFFEPKGQERLKSDAQCPCCGSTLAQIMNSGRMGCSQCYETFYQDILPWLGQIHNNVSHVGKLPRTADIKLKQKNRLRELKKQLQTAIEDQEFEQAARLRDQIKELEQEGDAQ